MKRHLLVLATTLLSPALASCGGSGTERIASAPPPPTSPVPSPTPTPTPQDVTFMAKPGTGNFARFATGELREITYDPDTKTYQVKVEDGNFYPVTSNRESPYWYTIFPPSAPEWGASVRNVSYGEGLSYTALASYMTPDYRKHSLTFGHPTPEEAIPKSGTGNFKGPISGEAIFPASSGWGDPPYAPIAGSISFTVDFGRGTLSGLLDPLTDCDCEAPRFNDYSFTALLTRNGFEGSFDLAAGPHNFINGIFTGPAAEESMGLWSFPYSYNGESKWVSGAFVAKRGQ